MSGSEAAKPFLEQIEAREQHLADQAEQTRAQIEHLTARLAGLDTEITELRITRKTLMGIAADLTTEPGPGAEQTPTIPAVPEHPAYQQILTVFAAADGPLRCRDLCQALDLPIIPKNTEGIRSKLKRLVSRGILTEPEPGLFAQPRP